jgi:hypothetical protein
MGGEGACTGQWGRRPQKTPPHPPRQFEPRAVGRAADNEQVRVGRGHGWLIHKLGEFGLQKIGGFLAFLLGPFLLETDPKVADLQDVAVAQGAPAVTADHLPVETGTVGTHVRDEVLFLFQGDDKLLAGNIASRQHHVVVLEPANLDDVLIEDVFPLLRETFDCDYQADHARYLPLSKIVSGFIIP